MLLIPLACSLKYALITAFCDRASGGKLVDASPAVEKHLTDELEKLARVYGAKGDEFTKFPTFNFAGNCHCYVFLTNNYQYLIQDVILIDCCYTEQSFFLTVNFLS